MKYQFRMMLFVFAINAYIFNEIMDYYSKMDHGLVNLKEHPIAGVHALVLAISGLALLIKLFQRIEE